MDKKSYAQQRGGGGGGGYLSLLGINTCTKPLRISHYWVLLFLTNLSWYTKFYHTPKMHFVGLLAILKSKKEWHTFFKKIWNNFTATFTCMDFRITLYINIIPYFSLLPRACTCQNSVCIVGFAHETEFSLQFMFLQMKKLYPSFSLKLPTSNFELIYILVSSTLAAFVC